MRRNIRFWRRQISRGWAVVWAVAVLAATMTATIPHSSRAESPPRTLSDEAKRHYQTGQAYYQDGKYAKAADELRKAYTLTPKPLLLYNIMLAEWRAGDLSEAITTAIRARKETLPRNVGEKVDARLTAFQTIQTSRALASELQPSEKPTADAGTDPPARSSDRDRGASPDTSSASGGAWRSIVGWSTLATGAAALGGAGLYAGFTREAVEDRNRALEGGNRDEARDIWRTEIRPRQQTGRILLYGGSGLAATGLTLLVIDAFHKDSADVAAGLEVGPRVGRGSLQLTVGGRF